MSRDKRYQKLLNSKRWAEVKRIVWQRAGGLCERCRREGFIRAGVDCHHKVPVESANPDDPKAMERLAYDVGNIELLCIPCHIRAHQEMGGRSGKGWLEPEDIIAGGVLLALSLFTCLICCQHVKEFISQKLSLIAYIY